MSRVVGIDLGDRKSHYCVLDEDGRVIEEGSVQSTPAAFKAHFGVLESNLIAIEVGVHSRWASRVLGECGRQAIVANPVRLKLIHKSSRKSDRVNACALARLVRVDPQLLSPVQHRSKEDQNMLSVLTVRDVLVRTRTKLINCTRMEGWRAIAINGGATWTEMVFLFCWPPCVARCAEPVKGSLRRQRTPPLTEPA